MKKYLFPFIFLFSVILIPLHSESTLLSELIDVDVSLMDLSRMTPGELDSLIKNGKFIIINGTISSITEIERSDENLILDLHIVSGRWIGLDRVEDYKCIVNISGSHWETRFPQRQPRVVTDDLILQNYQIMVIGKVTSYVMEDSYLKAVVDAEYIRRIQ